MTKMEDGKGTKLQKFSIPSDKKVTYLISGPMARAENMSLVSPNSSNKATCQSTLDLHPI